MIDIEVDERIFEDHTLTFSIRADDPKAAYLIEDAPVEVEGVRYFINTVVDLHDNETLMKTIVAEAGWMRLADLKRPGSFTMDLVTTTEGLDQILEGTGWLRGEGGESAEEFSLTANDSTVLNLIWQWAKITRKEVRFDTMTKRVNFVDQLGTNRGLGFNYGVNIESIKRTASAPKVTRLYAFGQNGLDVSSLNGGNTYIEDYSYYTALGYTEDEARENYRKDEIISDDAFIEAQGLYAWAQARLEVLAQPTILYEVSVVDLRKVLSVSGDLRFKCGDVVYVHDEILGWDLQARVSRMLQHPTDPEKDRVELSFSPNLIPDPSATSTRQDTTRNWELFESRNWITERKVRLPHTILHRIALRTIADAEWVVGFKLQGIAFGASELTIEATEDNTSDPIWTSYVKDLVDDDEVEFSFTYGQKEIPAGEYVLVIRAYSDTANAGVDIAELDTAFWVLARGTTREEATLENSVRFDYNGLDGGTSGGTIQTFTVPDDVAEVMIECHGAGGGPRGASNAGRGALVSGRFPVVAGAILDVVVGGAPTDVGGGWPNGGGNPFTGSGGGAVGSGGGGASWVTPQGGGMASAMVVAAAGGGSNRTGASRQAADAKGGDGGLNSGHAGWGLTPAQTEGVNYAGQGASAGAGGAAGTGGTAGTFGQGGDAASISSAFDFAGGGGGGGWYGGGGAGTPVLFGGGSYAGDGGGGSSYAGLGYDIEAEDGENNGHGYVIISWETPEE